MTWDQDQVDSFIKIFNWTNFEKKFCRLNTSNVGYSKSTDVYYWHKLRKTSASRLFRFFLNILGANQK